MGSVRGRRKGGRGGEGEEGRGGRASKRGSSSPFVGENRRKHRRRRRSPRLNGPPSSQCFPQIMAQECTLQHADIACTAMGIETRAGDNEGARTQLSDLSSRRQRREKETKRMPIAFSLSRSDSFSTRVFLSPAVSLLLFTHLETKDSLVARLERRQGHGARLEGKGRARHLGT